MASLLEKTGHLAKENQVMTGRSHSARLYCLIHVERASLGPFPDRAGFPREWMLNPKKATRDRFLKASRHTDHQDMVPIRRGGQVSPDCLPFCSLPGEDSTVRQTLPPAGMELDYWDGRDLQSHHGPLHNRVELEQAWILISPVPPTNNSGYRPFSVFIYGG